MACHGDRGQGLTDDWRQRGFGEDQNCWQSKCHATNHPPEGFSLVRFIPPAIGPNTLPRFTTAHELHDYLLASMPWWDPGSLTSDEAWQLTAFLLREDGLYPADREFEPQEAASISVHLPYHPQTPDSAGQWLFFALLALVLILLLAAQTRRPLLLAAHLRRPLLLLRHPDPVSVSLRNLPILAQQHPPPPSHRPVPAIAIRSEAISPPPLPTPANRSPGRSRPPQTSSTTCTPPPSRSPRPASATPSAPAVSPSSSACCSLVTGALEMFFYIPTPEQAGASIQVITFLVPFGALVRGLHFWAAQALVVVSAIHLLRILFTGAYAPPRRFNFLLGLGSLRPLPDVRLHRLRPALG